MGLLQELPTADRFGTILGSVIGDEAAGTGVAGVLRLLGGIQAANIGADWTSRLDGALASARNGGISGLTGGVVDHIGRLAESLPADPNTLLGPISDRLSSLRALAGADLPGQLRAGIDGLVNIQSLVQADSGQLFGSAAAQLDQLKAEFVSGALGQLGAWNASIGTLDAELAKMLEEPSALVADRVVGLLGSITASVHRLVLPEGLGPANRISSQLRTAISAERVATLDGIKTDLIGQMQRARTEFELGNVTNTVHLADAQASFERLRAELREIGARLEGVVGQEAASAQGVGDALRRHYDQFEALEIVDLASIGKTLTEAIGRLDAVVSAFSLQQVEERVRAFFGEIDGVITQFNLERLTDSLEGVTAELRSALDGLDAVLFEVAASLRDAFARVRETLRSLASQLGSYGPDGRFEFHVQRQIADFLTELQGTLPGSIASLLDELKGSVADVLQQIRTALEGLGGEIESVKSQLREALEGVNTQLKDADVPGVMEQIRQQLDDVLSQLGPIDFDPIVDQVVAQIDEMRGQVQKIDVSELNDFLREALKAAVRVLQELNFGSQISDVLLREFDAILDIPRGALSDLEAQVEGALERFAQMAPEAILRPLADVFSPVSQQLDQLSVDRLLEPIDAWRRRALAELDGILPGALLQPVVEAYDRVRGLIESASPERLIEPLQTLVTQAKADLQKVDFARTVTDLNGAVGMLKQLLENLSPERLFAPLQDAFDKVALVLEGFDPAALLEPATRLFDGLARALEGLDAEHTAQIGEALAPLAALPSAFDPQRNFRALQDAYREAHRLLQQAGVGKVIVDLKPAYDALAASFQPRSSGASATVASAVASLNPTRSEDLAQAAGSFQRLQASLQSAAAPADPPSDLTQRFEQIRLRLDSLVPTWFSPTMTPASIREALQRANLGGIIEEAGRLADAVRQRFAGFQPRLIQQRVSAEIQRLTTAVASLNPEAVASGIQMVVGDLSQTLDVLNLQGVADDVGDLVDEVRGIVSSLDPRPIIQQLQSLADEVKRPIADLNPAELLAGIRGPFEAAKAIVRAFDPRELVEVLQDVFDETKQILSTIDIGTALKPLTERLEQLRDELEEGLNRTEGAFKAMVAAIPV